jgi:hypothetical protein
MDDTRRVWNADIDRHSAWLSDATRLRMRPAAIALTPARIRVLRSSGAHGTAGTDICHNG